MTNTISKEKARAKLSPRQQFVLEAIRDAGGKIQALGGGYWSVDGKNPLIVPSTSCNTTCGTKTIYALEDRGLLRSLKDRGVDYRNTREITGGGRDALSSEEQS